jgi:hypothetical protein
MTENNEDANNKKLTISFLIATRGRLQLLIDAIRSIKENASPDVELEFLVRVDEDDYETLAGRDRIQGELIIGPRWCGYESVTMFINDLAAKSHGDWLIPWNDDSFMMTSKWDKLLPPADSIQIIWFHASYEWAFPAISRKVYELWGCILPMQAAADAILHEIWRESGRPCNKVEVYVNHLSDGKASQKLAIRPEKKVPPPQNPAYKNTSALSALLHNAH